MKAELDRALSSRPAASPINTVIPDVGREALADWEEGTGVFRSFDGDKLDELFGWSGENGGGRDSPMFNTHIDPNRGLDPHKQPDEFAQALAENRLEPLQLLWAQKVGRACALDNVMRGSPFICLDDVGLGKTILAASIIAALEYMRASREVDEDQKWPGIFGTSLRAFSPRVLRDGLTCDRAGDQEKYTLKDLHTGPHLVIVPNALVEQWLGEMHRVLAPGAFDILPYIGGATLESRRAFWEAFDKAKSQSQIIVCSMPVSQTGLDAFNTHRTLTVSRRRLEPTI